MRIVLWVKQVNDVTWFQVTLPFFVNDSYGSIMKRAIDALARFRSLNQPTISLEGM